MMQAAATYPALISSSVRPLVSSPRTTITTTTAASTRANITKIRAKPALLPLITSPDHLGTRLGYEDIITFPLLRNLTMVKGVHYPAEIRRYVEAMSAHSRVPLFDDRAV